MSAFDKKAIAVEVKITRPIDKSPIALLLAQKFFQEVFQAAAYNKGGRKIRKTISGFKLTMGIPGINPMASPARTNRMG
jgi:hypothetical protein